MFYETLLNLTDFIEV